MRNALKRESGFIIVAIICAMLAAATGVRLFEAHNGAAVVVDDYRQPASALIDINRAGADVLVSLPGIGEKLANRIVDARPYAAVDDLLRVDGVGEKLLESIRDRICVGN